MAKKAKVHKVGLTYRQMMAVRNAAHLVRKRMGDALEINREWEDAEETSHRAQQIHDLTIAVRKMTDVLTDAVLRGDK